MSLVNNRFDLHVVEKFFDESSCRSLVNEIRESGNSTAVVFGKSESGEFDERTRRVKRATVNNRAMAEVLSRLNGYLPQLRDYFGLPLGTVEEPQFLWYRPGDFFVAHQDGNTKLIQLESDRLRRVSVSIFLNRQSEGESAGCYDGGSLVFTDRTTDDRRVIRGETGKLVAFRSELTHEVTPVNQGDRFAIVTWYRIVA